MPELTDQWERDAARSPADATPCVSLARLHRFAGDWDATIIWLERAVARAPEAVAPRLELASALAHAGQLDRAVRALAAPGSAADRHPDLVFARAALQIRAGAVREAVAAVEDFLRVTGYGETDERRARALFAEHGLQDALARLLERKAATDRDTAFDLARLHFAMGATAAAERVLAAIVDPTAPPARQVADSRAIADLLRDQGRPAPAAAYLARAAALAPAATDLRIERGEILTALGRLDEAGQEFAAAYQLDPNPDHDRRLFDWTVAEHRAAGIADGAAAAAQAMADRARAAGDDASRLRAARWRWWAGDGPAALALLDETLLARNPQAAPALALQAEIALAGGQVQVAIAAYRRLITCDPDRRGDWCGRLARLLLQAGDADGAVAVLGEPAGGSTAPPDNQRLAELAVAQQEAGQWYDAVTTWEALCRSATGGRRAGFVAAYLRACQRLAIVRRGTEVVWELAAGAVAADDRASLLDQLAAACAADGRLDWLLEKLAQHARQSPADPVLLRALANAYRLAGRDEQAVAILADAALWGDWGETDDWATAELAGRAETVGDWAAAVTLRRRLAAATDQPRPATARHLAAAQEANLDFAGAKITWLHLAEWCPQDPAALGDAAAFCAAYGETAEAVRLWRRLRHLQPDDLGVAAHLAAAAPPGEALACWERILERTDPEPPGSPAVFPGSPTADLGRLQQAYFAVVSARRGIPDAEAFKTLQRFVAGGPQGVTEPFRLRLRAIGEISRLLARRSDRQALALWLDRWQRAGGPTERLWAEFNAGEWAAPTDPPSPVPTAGAEPAVAWIVSGLERDAWQELGRWFNDPDRTPTDRDLLLAAAVGRIERLADPAAVGRLAAALFPPGVAPSIGLWQGATAFAAAGHPPVAAALGLRAANPPGPPDPACGLTLARWQVLSGDRAGALRTLWETAGRWATSFEDAPLEALRQYLLLLPVADRRAAAAARSPADDAGDAGDRRRHLLDAVVAAAATDGCDAATIPLTALLRQRVSGVREEEDFIRPVSGRFLDFILATGIQFRNWGWDDLARRLWDDALADPAIIVPDHDANAAADRELRIRLAEVRLATARPEEYADLIGPLASYLTPEGLGAIATALADDHRWRAAAATLLATARRDPANRRWWHELAELGPRANLTAEAAAAVGRALPLIETALPPATVRQVLLEFAAAAAAEGWSDPARDFTDRAVAADGGTAADYAAAAAIRTALGDTAAAEAMLRSAVAMAPDQLPHRVALADLLREHGRAAEALRLLEEARRAPGQFAGTDLTLALALAAAATGDLARCRTLGMDLIRAGEAAAIERLAATLAAEPAPAAARLAAATLLRTAAATAKTPATAIGLQCRLVATLATDHPFLPAAANRLAAMARGAGVADGELAAVAEALLALDRRGYPAADQLLEALWDGGRGPAVAGVASLELTVRRGPATRAGPPLAAVVGHPGLTPGLIHHLLAELAGAGRDDLALAAATAALGRWPTDLELAAARARALLAAGTRDQAATAIAAIDLRRSIEPAAAVAAGRLWLALGDRDAAVASYAAAVAADPAATAGAAYGELAALLAARGHLGLARQAVARLAANPANIDGRPLADYLLAADRVGDWRQEFAALALTARQRREAWRALAARLAAAGRSAAALGEEPPAWSDLEPYLHLDGGG